MWTYCGVPFLSTIVLMTVLPTVRCQQSAPDNMSDLQMLDTLLKNYDRRATPTRRQGTPTEVSIELYIRSFGAINAATMDYQVDLYIYQSWTDPRLNHSTISKPMDLNDPTLVRAIWKPEVFFPNAKSGDFQYVTVPNVLLRIKPNGQIMYMLRLRLTFSCMMELSKYPLDHQTCSMEIASFAKTTSELKLYWRNDTDSAVRTHDSFLRMPQFQIQGIRTYECPPSNHIEGYSCLIADFLMSRSAGFHLVQTYLPTILIVIISWVSFWMDVDAVPARITLGVTTLLTISSKASDTQGNLPQVSYVKAMDVWMGTCTAFVFAALLEFTLTNYLWRKKHVPGPLSAPAAATTNGETKKPDNWPKFGVVKVEGDKAVSDFTETPNQPFHQISERAYKAQARHIDELSRLGFPAAFLLFNLCYWTFYLF